MPLNSLPPTTTVPNLEAKIRMARFGVEPGNEEEEAMLAAIEELKAGDEDQRLLDLLRRPRLDSRVGGLWCDLGFWGGLLPSNKVSGRSKAHASTLELKELYQADLKPLLEEGVKGFKCFMIDSGVEVSQQQRYGIDRCFGLKPPIYLEQEFPMVTEDDIEEAIATLRVRCYCFDPFVDCWH
jgi:hypothetical protein